MPPYDRAMTDCECTNSPVVQQIPKDSSIGKPFSLLQATKTTPRRRRGVSFGKFVKVKYTISLDSYTEEEIQDAWFSPTETKMLRKEAEILLRQMNHGVPLPEDARGLECRTAEGAQKRTYNKMISRQLVLDEQDAQWDHDINNPEHISLLYSSFARRCQQEAAQQGAKDALAAQDILEADSDMIQ